MPEMSLPEVELSLSSTAALVMAPWPLRVRGGKPWLLEEEEEETDPEEAAAAAEAVKGAACRALRPS